MFISPPNNFNQSSKTPMPKFGMYNDNDTRQTPMSGSPSSTTGSSTTVGAAPGTTTGSQGYELATTSPIINNPLYNQGWLMTQIGKYIKIEFLIGSNMYIDREGTLQEVGISYVVIKESGTNDILMCDIYSIKFVRVFDNQSIKCPV